MSVQPLIEQASALPFDEIFAATTAHEVRRALAKRSLSERDFLALLSPAAAPLLEEIAARAHEETVRHFGRQILFFAPLYLSNFCTNRCVYCGFNATNHIGRVQLTLEEARAEAEGLAASGIKHVLLLTGDARKKAPPEYIADCARQMQGLFASIAIEVYAMDEAEYALLADAGVDGMTMFQETYDPELYSLLHPAGPKRDYANRLNAPERACRAALRTVNIGALLGLANWRREAFLTGLHADYLQRRYPGVDVAVSLPRMRPHEGDWDPEHPVDDRAMVQIMTALRCFLPHAGITISTREDPAFRENILPLGVTRMSAGVSTAVGGYAERDDEERSVGQFEIADHRSVAEMTDALKARGYQPVFKDWEPI